jgi:hypothetical protein
MFLSLKGFLQELHTALTRNFGMYSTSADDLSQRGKLGISGWLSG